MKLIVGLGNPGAEYARTRHNAGFMVVERLAAAHRVTWARDGFGSSVGSYAQWQPGPVAALRPETMMNRSGHAVAAAVKRWKLEPSDILVVSDEVYLPFGTMKLTPAGGAGGHNGLASCIEALGTEAFARLRIGVGQAGRPNNLSTFVLAEFDPEEGPPLAQVIERAKDVCELWAVRGIEAAMNRANAPAATTD